jgi:hypothetical protein
MDAGMVVLGFVIEKKVSNIIRLVQFLIVMNPPSFKGNNLALAKIIAGKVVVHQEGSATLCKFRRNIAKAFLEIERRGVTPYRRGTGGVALFAFLKLIILEVSWIIQNRKLYHIYALSNR